MMSGRLGMPGMGLMSHTVFSNPKCQGCLHFEAQRGLYGLCGVGLQPASCGEGEDQLSGYAPVAATGPTMPEHLALVTPLTMGMATPLLRSIVSEMETEMRSYCPLHQSNSGAGEPMILRCVCKGLDEGLVMHELYEKLPNRVKVGTSLQSALDIVRAFMGISPTPGAVKRPSLPGVHAPNSSVRKPLGLQPPKKVKGPFDPKPPGSGIGKSLEKSISDVEELEKSISDVVAAGKGKNSFDKENNEKYVAAAKKHVAEMGNLSASDHFARSKLHHELADHHFNTYINMKHSPSRQVHVKHYLAHSRIGSAHVEAVLAKLSDVGKSLDGDDARKGLEELEVLVEKAGHYSYGGTKSSAKTKTYTNDEHKKMGVFSDAHGAEHHVDDKGVFHVHTEYSSPSGGGVEVHPVKNLKELRDHMGY